MFGFRILNVRSRKPACLYLAVHRFEPQPRFIYRMWNILYADKEVDPFLGVFQFQVKFKFKEFWKHSASESGTAFISDVSGKGKWVSGNRYRVEYLLATSIYLPVLDAGFNDLKLRRHEKTPFSNQDVISLFKVMLSAMR